MVWNRYSRGRPLFTICLTDLERTHLARGLRLRVIGEGLAGLTARAEVTRNFVLYASDFLARRATRLQWRELLLDLTLPREDIENQAYVVLYDRLWDALAGLGRPGITQNGERRFLATLLREGGLPTFIGDVADTVATEVSAIGWDALLEPSGCEWVAARVHAASSGAAKRLLDGLEGRAALTDFILQAASARRALSETDADFAELKTPQDVKDALLRRSITLPATANEALLFAVLGTFGSTPSPKQGFSVPFRFRARTDGHGIRFQLRVELNTLGLEGLLPDGIQRATLSVEPSRQLQRAIARPKHGTWHDFQSNAEVDFDVRARGGETSIGVRFAGAGGALQVVPIGDIAWPEKEMLWFDQHGELIGEDVETLQPEDAFLLVVFDERALSVQGQLNLTELAAPTVGARAYRLDVSGPGALIINDQTQVHEIIAQEKRLRVRVGRCRADESFAGSKYVRTVPEIIVEDDVAFDVFVRVRGETEERRVRENARGGVALTKALRDAAGTVRVRLVAADGRRWSASWTIVPKDLRIDSVDGKVIVRGEINAIVHAAPGSIDRQGDLIVVTPDPGANRVDLFLNLRNGETLRIPVVVARGAVRLWEDSRRSQQLALSGTAVLTERQINRGAMLELASGPGAQLVICTHGGESVLRVVQPSEQRVLVSLIELARYLHSAKESLLRFRILVNDQEVGTFAVNAARFAKPKLTWSDQGLLLEAVVDPREVPDRPAIVLISTRELLGTHTLHDVLPMPSQPGKLIVRLPMAQASDAPSQIAFLVDRSAEHVRPVSGGTLVMTRVHGGEQAVTVVHSAGTQQVAIPRPTQRPAALPGRIAEKILGQIGALSPGELETFLEQLGRRTPEFARYGLQWFELFSTIVRRCPWVLLAAAQRLPETERYGFLALWSQGVREFSWVYIRSGDATRLGRELPTLSEPQRVKLVKTADDAHPMPKAIEYLLHEGLFSTQSIPPFAAMRAIETNAHVVIHDSFHSLSLPRSPNGSRWLVGADLDPDLLEHVEASLDTQILHGARARAIRDLLVRHEVPRHKPQLHDNAVWQRWPEEGARRLVEWILKGIDQDRIAVMPRTQLGHQIVSLDRELAIAAVWVGEYREERAYIDGNAFQQIHAAARCSPDLFDFWLVAVQVLRRTFT